MIEDVVEGDLDFLIGLRKKLDKGKSRPGIVRINLREMKKMLSLMNKPEGDFAISPFNFIFNTGFVVYHILRPEFSEQQFRNEWILDFREYQMPGGYDWSKMSEVYMCNRNRDLLRLAKREEPKEDRSYYEY